MAFHLDLIKASGNVVIYVLMEKLYKLLEATRKKAVEFQMDLKTYRHQDYLNHMKIFQAVKNRKPEEAVKAMIDHLRTFEDVIFGKKGKGE
jgi:DNA-binding FadR family transcriptional regulator